MIPVFPGFFLGLFYQPEFNRLYGGFQRHSGESRSPVPPRQNSNRLWPQTLAGTFHAAASPPYFIQPESPGCHTIPDHPEDITIVQGLTMK